MSEIQYIKGDATNPGARGVKIIAHICNDLGKWGKGFVLAISKKWPHVRQEYLRWYNDGAKLGEVQFVEATPHIVIANMIAQKGIKTGSKGPPIRYDAVKECLYQVGEGAIRLNATVHMPRIGCGLAGAKWGKIEPIIEATLLRSNIQTFVYDFD